MKKIILLIILIITIVISSKVKAYTEYKIGDIVSYNDMEFYVIKNSGSNEESVTMLKKEVLTLEELQKYSNGLEFGINKYGEMMYHERSSNYATSYVKIVIDAWAQDKIQSGLQEARLITYEELQNNLGYSHGGAQASWINLNPEYTPSWVYDVSYNYWTMTPYEDSTNGVWYVSDDGRIRGGIGVSGSFSVRPVITLSKTALGDIDESIIDEDNNASIIDEKNNDSSINNNTSNNIKDNNYSVKVNVPNTYLTSSIIIILLGFISACTSIVIYYIIKKKKGV